MNQRSRRTVDFAQQDDNRTSAKPESAINFLSDKAAELQVPLPPLAKTPKQWPRLLRAPSGPPDVLSSMPAGFMRAVIRASLPSILLQSFALTVGSVIGATLPFIIGRSVDSAIKVGLTTPTWTWLGIFVALVALMSVGDGINQIAEVSSWMKGALGSSRTVGHRVAKAGRAAKQDKPAGDVVTAILNDSDHVGTAIVFIAEVVAATAAFIAVAIIMFSMSTSLALVVIIGLPIAIVGVTLLVKPMQEKLAAQREEQGRLTTISADAVSGLRVLRGVGGEEFYNARYKAQSQKVKAAGIKVAGNQAALAVMRNSVPQLFIAVVAGYGALLTFEGRLTPGDLVAFFGMTAYLRNPINVAAWSVQMGTRAWVGAKKLAEFHSLEPQTSDDLLDPSIELDKLDPGTMTLVDVSSGISVEPGLLTALVSPSPEISTALARRLARVEDSSQALLSGIDLRALPLGFVRQNILLSEADPQLFRGTLHGELRGAAARPLPMRGTTELIYREHVEEAARAEGSLFRPDRVPNDDRLREAMRIADAEDVLESLEGGLAGWLSERGRNLSGGQRQRVALARAIYADAPIFIALEPTSAVDSHTEERISAKIRDDRKGKTTLVVTASPLWLEKCDQIIVLDEGGTEVARGNYLELKKQADSGEKGALLYRQIVQRQAGGDDETTSR